MKLHGILLLDKPTGFTSNQVLQRVKRSLKVSTKAGHTGCLDPLATGMLPICFGEATKFSHFLLNADKSYEVVVQLGIKTDTGDLNGEIIGQNDKINQLVFDANWLTTVLSTFIGTILQEPPIYSALKFQGTPLYKLARKSKQNQHKLHDINLDLAAEFKSLVQSKARLVKIYQIKILDFSITEQKICLAVDCSKGTYIRSLIEDLGSKLGCYATVAALRRSKVGKFNSEQMISLDKLRSIGLDATDETAWQKILLPVEQCLVDFPKLDLTSQQALELQQGKKIYIENLNILFGVNKLLSLFYDNHTLLGLGESIEDNILTAKRLVSKR